MQIKVVTKAELEARRGRVGSQIYDKMSGLAVGSCLNITIEDGDKITKVSVKNVVDRVVAALGYVIQYARTGPNEVMFERIG